MQLSSLTRSMPSVARHIHTVHTIDYRTALTIAGALGESRDIGVISSAMELVSI